MKSALQNAVLALTVLFSLVAAAWSQCNNPPSPGVVICTPTNGSTVVYNNEISIRSTPAPGASITGFSIYANKVLIYQSPQGQSGIALYDAAIQNGNHNLIVKAGDTAGSLYEAKTSFTVTGQGDGDCALPNSPGIDLCNPPAGAVYGMGVTAGASAKGQSQISKIAFYLNGKFVASAPGTPTLAVPIQLAQQSTPYTVRVDALDSSGNKYTPPRRWRPPTPTANTVASLPARPESTLWRRSLKPTLTTLLTSICRSWTIPSQSPRCGPPLTRR